MKKIQLIILNLLRKLLKFYGFAVIRENKLEIQKHIDNEYGHYSSKLAHKAIDKNGDPIPWFTYPAIEWLDNLDLSTKHIFEWGVGHSTLYFSNRCKQIVGVEHDKKWFDHVRNKIGPNSKIFLLDESKYTQFISNQNKKFDCIIIDSLDRIGCANEALLNLAEDGFIILDNSDWFPKTCEKLRKSGLIQIDFHGFGPINPYTWTTSAFLKKTVKLEFKNPNNNYSKCAIRKIHPFDEAKKNL